MTRQHKTTHKAPAPALFYNVRTQISRDAERALIKLQYERREATGKKVPLADLAQELLEAALLATANLPPTAAPPIN